MGDLFFILRMFVYTLIIVLFMQVKIGSTTIEEKVIQWTHESSVTQVFKDISDGAVTFLGAKYNQVTKDIKTPFTEKRALDQIPGKRLKAKIEETKAYIKKQFDGPDESNKEGQPLPEKN